MSDKAPSVLSPETLNRLFNEQLFECPSDADDEFNEYEGLLYHQVYAIVEQQDQLADYLPSPPMGVLALLKELESPNTDFGRVRAIAQESPKVVGEIIRVANSPLYLTRSGEITSLDKAVMLLGLNGIMKVAMTVMMRDTVQLKSPRFQRYLDPLWKFCLLSGEAHQFVGKPDQGFENFVLGLLHEIGGVTILSLVSHFLDNGMPGTGNDRKVLKRVMQERSAWLSALVAAEWKLPQKYLLILNEFDQLCQGALDEDDVQRCEPQTRSLQVAAQCAQLYSLAREATIPYPDLVETMEALGFPEKATDKRFTRLELTSTLY